MGICKRVVVIPYLVKNAVFFIKTLVFLIVIANLYLVTIFKPARIFVKESLSRF